MLRVKQYLNNIRIPVDELGKTFDISFYYYHKKDYYKFKAKEEAIEETYQKLHVEVMLKLKQLLKLKLMLLIFLNLKNIKLVILLM